MSDSGKLSDIVKCLKPEFYSTLPGAHGFPSPGILASVPKPMTPAPMKMGIFCVMGEKIETWAKLQAPSNEQKVLFFPTMPENAAFSIFSLLLKNPIQFLSSFH